MALGVSVWLAGSVTYLLWNERAGRELRRQGIMKDIIREESRIKACKECGTGNLQFVNDDGFAQRWKADNVEEEAKVKAAAAAR
ncbi:hypothetical protein DIPPA_16994 [Diplonema papillatum]|nr:hypothetical protein DIPPA_16994 [Diplonema papillatum]